METNISVENGSGGRAGTKMKRTEREISLQERERGEDGWRIKWGNKEGTAGKKRRGYTDDGRGRRG